MVVGHSLRGLVDRVFESSVLTQVLDQWIYAFHIPLFFFLSGLLMDSALKKTFQSTLWSKVKTIVYPYCIWSIIQTVVRFFVIEGAQSPKELWRIIYMPTMQFWFLYVLFIFMIAYVALRKLKVPVPFLMLICIALFISKLLTIRIGDWTVLYMLRPYGIYFMLGVLAKQNRLIETIETLKPASLLMSIVGGYGIVMVAAALDIANSSYLMLICAILGIFSSLSMAKLLDHLQAFRFIKRWGILSLEIFVAHTIFSAFIRVMLQKVLNIDDVSLHILLSVAIGIYGPILLCRLCAAYDFPYLFRLRMS